MQQNAATGGVDGPALISDVHSEGNHNEFDWKIKHLHKGVVYESPGARSLQDVVQVILKSPITHVPPAALRAVHQRLPEQAEPSTLLPPVALRAARTCASRG